MFSTKHSFSNINSNHKFINSTLCIIERHAGLMGRAQLTCNSLKPQAYFNILLLFGISIVLRGIVCFVYLIT